MSILQSIVSTKEILKSGVQVVLFFFAAFGAFLTNIAPPEETESSFAIGISSFGALTILFFVKSTRAVSNKLNPKLTMMIAFVFLITSVFLGFTYHKFYIDNTFVTIPAKYDLGTPTYGIKGIVFLPGKRDELEQKFKGDITEMYMHHPSVGHIWTESSINTNKSRLVILYVLFSISTGTALFILIEGLISSKGSE